MDGKKILGSNIAKEFIKELQKTIYENKIDVKLVTFLANDDPAAEKYAEVTAKACAETGVKYELRKINREILEDAIIEANNDPMIHGILVYYPVFGGGHDQYIQNCVNPAKDVEGLCHTYRFNMYNNRRFLNGVESLKSIIPCTPLAVVKILEYCNVYDMNKSYGNHLSDKIITIINRSEVVGRPLAALCANDGAKVYSIDIGDILEFDRGHNLQLPKYRVHDSDKRLEDILPISDVVVTGVPNLKYKVSTDLLKPGVIAINFSSCMNFEDNVVSRASIFVPAIGKVTTTMLQRNLLRLKKHQMNWSIKYQNLTDQ
ncbi:uncharacterized protein LOC128957595 [Oppia nitens]|uniref:uncharacterized protein LOC128957595 n=1 Tax=Oppia nitens TaxID=1686743 RepID=UPI0023DC73C6|nr:uncharacterized protein LOC128957595 [Oppia nitens]